MKLTAIFFRLIFFLVIGITLQCCQPDEPGVWLNGQIKAGKLSDFHALNTLMMDGLKSDDPKRLFNIITQEMIDDPIKYRVVDLVSYRIKADNYSLINEYYVINKYWTADTLSVNNKGINNYHLRIEGTPREQYIAFFVAKSAVNQYLLTAMYGKFKYGWKLYTLGILPYTKNGKTAPELYHLAQQQYAKNYLYDALNLMAQARECATPSTGWEYNNADEMIAFYTKVAKDIVAKYKFPLVVSEVPTHPRIFTVINQTMDDGVFPEVYYLSSIKLKDTTALKKENEGIRKQIGKLIPGIDQNKKYIYYAAFNQWPDGKNAIPHYDLKQRLK